MPRELFISVAPAEIRSALVDDRGGVEGWDVPPGGASGGGAL